MSSISMLASAILNVSQMSDDDLRRLNEVVVSELRNRHSRKEVVASMKFNVGDVVSFVTKRGQTVRGTVEKVNAKSISVDAGMMKWKVSPTLLKKA